MTAPSDLAVALPAPVMGGGPREATAREAAAPAALEGSWLRGRRLKASSDEELMSEMQRDSAQALTVLFDRHARLVWQVAYRVLRDAGEAEETVQQVFLGIFRQAARFDPARGSFRSWLLTLSYHAALNRKRLLAADRCYRAAQIDDLQNPSGFNASVRPPENAILVEQALASLRPRQRRTIECVYFEGLTAEEVAQRTGESVRAVRHQLYRGLSKLRVLLTGGGASRGSSAGRGRPQAEKEGGDAS